jgi:hypothetical protein
MLNDSKHLSAFETRVLDYQYTNSNYLMQRIGKAI